MKRHVRVLSLGLASWFVPYFCLVAQAQANWLTVVGDPGEPQRDLVEVQPHSVVSSAGVVTLNVRVSRSAQRTSSDGVTFRSFTAKVMIDCVTKTGRFTETTFYMAPLWSGEPHKTLSYPPSDVRPMLFRSIEPNPTWRIIRAACPNAPAG